YFRQEKYELAEYHFSRALSINTASSVLHTYLGMVFHANGKSLQALNMLARASAIQPDNPQARFQRANVLMKLDRYQEAQEELERVRDHAPREASVHFLLGKICKRLGKREKALRHFLLALDFDPKDGNLVKAAIDQLELPEEAEEEEEGEEEAEENF
ncbi:anaphase-promoting complex subunit 3, partial [Nannochloropsis gaditana CCMP526]